MAIGTPGVTRYPNAPRPDTIEAGNSFEDFVCDKLSEMGINLRTYKSKDYQLGIGENKIGWEIKLDQGCMKYGHLSIEVGEKSRDDENLQWTRSGILRNDNAWLYIQGNFDCFWILFKPALKRYFLTNKFQLDKKFGTILTFYLDFDIADQLGMRIQK